MLLKAQYKINANVELLPVVLFIEKYLYKSIFNILNS